MLKHWLVVILAVLLHFLLRANNLNDHYPYMDEGFHAHWAKIIWQFDRHPAIFADGKLLMYYWSGLFQGEGMGYLFAVRMSVAIASCITAVGVYQIAKTLFNHQLGIIALLLYAIFPLALFYERFLFADPLASMFAVLVAWRSIEFAKNPTLPKSVILGILLAGATLSKLTLGLIPLVPVFATFLLTDWIDDYSFINFVIHWTKRFLGHFVIMAGIVVLAWLPIIIPVYLSTFTDTPMILVPNENVESTARDYVAFAREIFNEIGYFVGGVFLGGILILSIFWVTQKKSRYTTSYIIIWFALIAILPFLTASLSATRYYMPLSAPLVLLIVMCTRWLWQTNNLIRIILIGIGGAWLAFIVPFSLTIATNPNEAPIQGYTYTEFQAGSLIGEKTAHEAAQFINQNIRQNELLYGDWGVCYTLYFYLETVPTCLEKFTPVGNLVRITTQLPNETTLVMFGFDIRADFFTNINTGTWETLGEVSQFPLSRSIRVWRFTRQQ